MADYDHLSDEELDNLLAKSDPYAHLSDSDLDKMLASSEPKGGFLSTVGGTAMDALGYLGNKYDQYITAPARSGTSKLIEGDIPGSVIAWWNQVGEDPSLAPSGKDLATKIGFSDKKTPYPAEKRQKFDEMFNPGFAKSLKQAGKSYEDTELPSNADVAGQALNFLVDPALAIGGALKIRGLLNAPKAEEAAKMLEASNLKPNAEEIKSAASRLGVEPTRGMLSGEKHIQELENVLANKSTIPGLLQSQKYKPIYKAMDESLGTLKSENPLTPNEFGNEAKRQIMGKIAERLDPIRSSYENIKESTRAAPIDEKMALKASQRLLSQPIAKGSGTSANQVIKKYAEMIGSARDAETVQNIISDAKSAMREAEGPSRAALGRVVDSGEKLLRRGLLTSAKEGAGKAGTMEAKGLLRQIKDTNKAFKNLSGEVSSSLDSTPVRATSPSDILNQVDTLQAEKLQKGLFDVGNVDALKSLKEFSPETFEIARQQRINQLIEASTTKGQVSPQKFINNLRKIPRDAQELLFEKGVPTKLKDVETLLNAMPSTVNPSGTAKFLEISKKFSPKHMLLDNAYDYAKYRQLQGKSPVPLKGVSKGILKAGKLGQVKEKSK